MQWKQTGNWCELHARCHTRCRNPKSSPLAQRKTHSTKSSAFNLAKGDQKKKTKKKNRRQEYIKDVYVCASRIYSEHVYFMLTGCFAYKPSSVGPTFVIRFHSAHLISWRSKHTREEGLKSARLSITSLTILLAASSLYIQNHSTHKQDIKNIRNSRHAISTIPRKQITNLKIKEFHEITFLKTSLMYSIYCEVTVSSLTVFLIWEILEKAK